MLYHVIHENLEDEKGPTIRSDKTYPRKEASKKARALAEKYPDVNIGIMPVGWGRSDSADDLVTIPAPLPL